MRIFIHFIPPNGIAQMRLALFNDTVNDIKGKIRRSAVKPLSFSPIVPQISVINDHHYSHSILHCFYCDFFKRLRKNILIYWNNVEWRCERALAVLAAIVASPIIVSQCGACHRIRNVRTSHTSSSVHCR